ncbi:DUF4747 family protein [Flectobacillus roseus]
MSKLLFARYTIVSATAIQNKITFLIKGLENVQKITANNLIYRFTEVEPISIDETTFITGFLVKYKPEDEEEVYNELTDSIQKESVPNKIQGRARFLIHPSSSIIIFKETPGNFSSKLFIDKFCTLFERNHGGFLVEMYIETIKEQYSFLEKLNSFQRIEKIEMTLFPSNPNHGEMWKDVDIKLRNNNISKYKEIQENKKNTSIIVDNETKSKILMAEDGYGATKASGINEHGRPDKISTNRNEKTISIPIVNQIDNAKEIITLVSNTLSEVISRTQQQIK